MESWFSSLEFAEPLEKFFRAISADSPSILLEATMMNRLCTTGPQLEKLSQLRAKTDRQLLGLIHSKLDFSLRFAVLAGVEQSAGNRTSAEQSLEHATQAFIEVQKLLPTLSAEQRRWLEPKLSEVRESVERICELPRVRRAFVA